MTVEIAVAERVEPQLPDDIAIWSCWLEINQGSEAWMLPTTAPGTLTENELQAYFDAREAELWRVAQAKQYPVDVFERVAVKRVLKAFALLVMDEINILRQLHGLPERTPDQIVAGIKAKLR